MDNKQSWNVNADHPLQAWEWGEFREQTGVKVVRRDGLQVTIHQIPHTKWCVGYCPKSKMLGAREAKTLKEIATEHNCIFIKCEPKVETSAQHTADGGEQMKKLGFVGGRPLFTKYNFVLDLSPTLEQLMAGFKQKTRYNIRVAEKKGVSVAIDNSQEAFKQYLKLTEETTKRQGFYAHGRKYHEAMWEALGQSQISDQKFSNELRANQLTAQLLVARYGGKIITAWVLFKFKDTLYYPYGASTREHREVMANNLVMWEAIKLGKTWGCQYLDMWGALGPEPDKSDPWYGFHNFKAGYGARHVEYIGTWDYIAKPALYRVYRAVDSLRWIVLRMIK